MVGVCLTVIGIFSVIRSFSKVGTVGDDITGIDAVLFLAACLISYVAMKTRDRARRLRLERCADTLFLAGLALMVVICMFLVYVLNQRG
jgi:ABC-type xylose transport system permease subunit